MDQDGSGICWSYLAALLIDGYRFSHGDQRFDKITSPIALAVGAADNDRNANGYGYAQDAIAYARQAGFVCSHEIVSTEYKSTDFYRSDSARFWPSNPKSRATQLATLWPSTKNLSSFAKTQGEPCQNPVDVPLTIGEEMTAPVQSLLLSYQRAEVSDLCSKDRIATELPEPNVRMVNTLPDFQNKANVSNFIAGRLSKDNPQPVGIAYCEDVLRDKSVRSINEDGFRQGCKNHHLSAVVGSRPGSNGKCEFLVRNSYGASCAPYQWPCERGQVWIDSDALAANVEAFIWLE